MDTWLTNDGAKGGPLLADSVAKVAEEEAPVGAGLEA
jgi:hypothetical protein